MKVPAYQFVNSGNNMFNQTNLDNVVYYDNEKQREFFVNSSIGHITGGILIIPPNVNGRVTVGYWGNGNGESFGIKATATVMSNVALINIGIPLKRGYFGSSSDCLGGCFGRKRSNNDLRKYSDKGVQRTQGVLKI